MQSTKDIPIYSLNTFSKWGIFIRSMHLQGEDPRTKQAHRDKNYIFIFQQSGQSSIMVDFKKVELSGPAAYFILPGQVHHGFASGNAKGNIIAMNSDLVPEYVRLIFEQSFHQEFPVVLDSSWTEKTKSCIGLLQSMFSDPASGKYELQIVQSLSQTLATMFAAVFSQKTPGSENKESRSALLTIQFKSLLQKEYKTMKSPKDYAEKLNISPAYLNQVVKKNTGMPPSYWIHEEIILEAKRLLFYTELSVKEIAHSLGYDDPAYFSRLFVNSTGKTPLSFRQNSRK